MIRVLVELCQKCFMLDEDEMADQLEDAWEDFGEIILHGSVSFSTESIVCF